MEMRTHQYQRSQSVLWERIGYLYFLNGLSCVKGCRTVLSTASAWLVMTTSFLHTYGHGAAIALKRNEWNSEWGETAWLLCVLLRPWLLSRSSSSGPAVWQHPEFLIFVHGVHPCSPPILPASLYMGTTELDTSQWGCYFLSWEVVRWGGRMRFGLCLLLFSKSVCGFLWCCHLDLWWGWVTCFREASNKTERVSPLQSMSLGVSSAILLVSTGLWFPWLSTVFACDALIWG